MKRTILASIIGIATAMAATSSYSQTGGILLDNYTGSGAQIFLNGAPLLNNTPAGVNWTIGIYGVIGDVTVAFDPTGEADPSILGPLNLLSGSPGDTTSINNSYGDGGYFAATRAAVLPGYSTGTATFMVVAYDGSTYDTSAIRGHSTAFNLTPATGANPPPPVSTLSGGMQSFDIIIPEPSMFPLFGIAASAFVLIRRKKAVK